jgi:GR25 family glycosyltransferase involved in LPS biosynthesis
LASSRLIREELNDELRLSVKEVKNLMIEIKHIFLRNDFNYRKGIIGCALSHINLWKQLIQDTSNDYYIILEDDIEVCEQFKDKLSLYQNIIENELKDKYDLFYLGYTLRNDMLHDRFTTYPSILYNRLFTNKYSGGTFGYIIHKSFAIKLIDDIYTNSVSRAIDFYMADIPNVRMFNAQPHILFSDSIIINPSTNSDIQGDMSTLL